MELINHFKMLEMRMMRMIGIDRNREQAIEQEHDKYGRYYLGDAYHYLGHLHISDHWNALKKEKKLTQWEMKK